MKIAEIKDLATPELKERLEADVKAYEQQKINHSISPLDNPSLITRSRKGIARMKTELRSRELSNK
ncbi:MAG: 50S ribosomal protein L29 [Candidatus Symbiothrix sp.]|jgi:large subunit ribosomal protein L29|nr:50S ribosomal protein L29 [Candidatus Symbiothrix sp.]